METYPILQGKITPTDVKVYIEDGTPYLDYTGITYGADGCKVKVHLPKIDLCIEYVSRDVDYKDWTDGRGDIVNTIKVREQIYADNGKWMEYEILEREMTKEQVSKALGYKVKIKED